jgi:hypothetical protein
MPKGDNEYWQPGQSGNPAGRPKGSRNRRTVEMFELLESRGDKDPIDFLSDYITHGKDDNLKIQAANIVAPYKHSKQSTTPAPRFIPEPITVPNFQTIEEAENYLASLPVLLGKGEIDSQSALELSTLIKNWISAKFDHEELQLKLAAHGGPAQQIIHIEGGLPTLPGCENLIMPVLNGHQHEIDAINGEALPAPSEPSAQQTENTDGNQGSS